MCQSIDTNWGKSIEKWWLFEGMSLRILQKTSKNLDFWKTCVKISYVIHPKASIHTKRSCGNIEQSAASTKRNSQISINFHRANFSEISSTCIGTVRHTRHKFLGFFFPPKIPTGVPIFVEAFLKDPYEYGHFGGDFLLDLELRFTVWQFWELRFTVWWWPFWWVPVYSLIPINFSLDYNRLVFLQKAVFHFFKKKIVIE